MTQADQPADNTVAVERYTQKAAKTAKPQKARKAIAATGRASLALVRFFSSLTIIAAVILAGIAIGGFVDFSQQVTRPKALASDAKADGIVVLTGAPARIEKGLELLGEGRGQRLLISGVGAQTSDAEVKRRNPAGANLFECCVDTERLAENTVGNAEESAKWIKGKGYASIILVTSDYHMPRSLMAFRQRLPGVTIQSYSVPKVSAMEAQWWLDQGALRLMINEYIKYIGAGIRNRF
ncbi:MAG: YdcF family protein [Pseudomonadota bacterium]